MSARWSSGPCRRSSASRAGGSAAGRERMAILVTGGAGYIGSVTVELLLAQGERVVVLDDLHRGHRGALDTNVPFYHGRVGDRELVKRITSDHEIESCVHFAA